MKNYRVRIDWNTGQETVFYVTAWDDNSAKVLAMAQFPRDLHERMIVNVYPVEL